MRRRNFVALFSGMAAFARGSAGRQFETARMYTAKAPAIDLARLYGVTTFELG
jgi:hypothetical protein